MGRKYRSLAAEPRADVARIINDMLAELHASHTGYYTPDEIAYYDLADIFSHGLRRELEKHFAKGEVAYHGIGMFTRAIEGRHFISGLFDGFPAAEAKLAGATRRDRRRRGLRPRQILRREGCRAKSN